MKGGKIPFLHTLFPISAADKASLSAPCTGISETQPCNTDKLPRSITLVLLLLCIWNDWQENLAVRNCTSVSCMVGCSFLVPHFWRKYCSFSLTLKKMYGALCVCMCPSNFGLWKECVWLQKLVLNAKPKKPTEHLSYRASYYWTHRNNNQSNKFKVSIGCPDRYILKKSYLFSKLSFLNLLSLTAPSLGNSQAWNPACP